MRSRHKARGRAQSEILIVAVVSGILLVYFMHRMAVTARAKERVVAALAAATPVEKAAQDYRDSNQEWPESIYDMHLEPHVTAHGAAFSIDFSDRQLILTFDPDQDRLAGKTLVLNPSTSVVSSDWSCTDGTVDTDYRPKDCLPYSL